MQGNGKRFVKAKDDNDIYENSNYDWGMTDGPTMILERNGVSFIGQFKDHEKNYLC